MREPHGRPRCCPAPRSRSASWTSIPARGENFGLTYDDITPWLGKRAAVAAFPASTSDSPVDAAVVLVVTDHN
jgi:hypothetical protein